ncbi:hippocampus abundant transcript-like protein 1 [Plectropomus leopardus]|uniref:hippocampus abundant transcript-like protein 1 n=1 Tax=Plectropomus leopardus TaxID=160734 RepID=UPI001C4BB501|nr:hippocampus abundant transcript-like protein 1 [Plectropomus leopardus]
MITGIRGLCNGLGPALYGFIFFLFNVELNTMDPIQGEFNIDPLPLHSPTERGLIPGPPFLLGACTVVVAFLVALFIPEKPSCSSSPSQLSLSDKPHLDSKESMSSLAGVHINTPLPGSDEENPPAASDEDFEPLLQDSIV